MKVVQPLPGAELADAGVSSAAWLDRNLWAEPCDLHFCCFRSRRRMTRCQFSGRLFSRMPPARWRLERPQMPDRGAIRRELVRGDALRVDALVLEQPPRELQRRALVAPLLHQYVEDLAFVVDGAPQVHPAATNPDDHLVQMPS